MIVLSKYGYESRFLNDRFNIGGMRRQSNTARSAYNCGGFALGTFSWYVPYDVDILDYAIEVGAIKHSEAREILEAVDEDNYYWEEQDFLECQHGNDEVGCLRTYDGWSATKICHRIEAIYSNLWGGNSIFMDYFARKILTDNIGVRFIRSLAELKPNEYCIAFRVGGGDFHFIRSNDSYCNLWIEKRGTTPINVCPKNEPKCVKDSEQFFDFLFNWRRLRYISDTLLFAKENKRGR